MARVAEKSSVEDHVHEESALENAAMDSEFRSSSNPFHRDVYKGMSVIPTCEGWLHAYGLQQKAEIQHGLIRAKCGGCCKDTYIFIFFLYHNKLYIHNVLIHLMNQETELSWIQVIQRGRILTVSATSSSSESWDKASSSSSSSAVFEGTTQDRMPP